MNTTQSQPRTQKRAEVRESEIEDIQAQLHLEVDLRDQKHQYRRRGEANVDTERLSRQMKNWRTSNS